MKGEGGMPGAEGLKGEPGTPVRLLLFNHDALYEIYILIFLYFLKCFTTTQKFIFCSQGIDGLPGEKADKGSKGEAGLNVSKTSYRKYG